MQSNIQSIIAAIKIVKKESPDSEAIPLLEEALKKSMKVYILDMASMGNVIDIEDVKKEFENGLGLLNVMKK